MKLLPVNFRETNSKHIILIYQIINEYASILYENCELSQEINETI